MYAPPPAVLVTDPATRQAYSLVRHYGARRALTEGLAAYLRTLEEIGEDGSRVAFKAVYAEWPSPDEPPAEYPSAAIVLPQPAVFDTSSLVPHLEGSETVAPKTYLAKTCELTANLFVDGWVAGNAEDVRGRIEALLEDGLAPVDWMFGIRLALPAYYGVHAEYQMTDVAYVDSAEDAQQAFRVLRVGLEARVPVVRVVKYPLARVLTRVLVNDLEA